MAIVLGILGICIFFMIVGAFTAKKEVKMALNPCDDCGRKTEKLNMWHDGSQVCQACDDKRMIRMGRG